MLTHRRTTPIAAWLVALLAPLVFTVGPAAADEAPQTQETSRATEPPEPNTVTAYGTAQDHGPAAGFDFASPLVGMAAHPDGGGYWLVAADGGVFSFGGVTFHGSAGDIDLVSPIVGMAAHPEGGGYWLVAADGGVFSFGRARFHGSMGGKPLNQRVVGMAPSTTGDGYWLVAADGGIFSFGDARFHGSAGDIRLVSPIVGMASAPTASGYWLVAADGGVFSYGGAVFVGSEGGNDLPYPIVGMAPGPNGRGYWLAARDGQIYAHGVTDHGSAADHERPQHAPAVGIAAHGPDGYWLVHGGTQVTEVEDRGPAVADLQRRLRDLGYWLGPVDGVFGELTEQAVFAFQKYQGLRVDGRVGPSTSAALRDSTRPRPRSTSGDLLEVDKSRQLLFVVRGGRTLWVFNTSTGTEEPYTYEGQRYLADTPPGRWQVYREVDGYRTSNLGRLYRPKYFHRDGIAVHGYSFVPPYPASHGCVRVTNPAIDFLWAQGLVPIGAGVWVYGESPEV